MIFHIFRDIAAKRPSISRVRLHTFANPRVEDGRLNTATKEDMVVLMDNEIIMSFWCYVVLTCAFGFCTGSLSR